MVKYYSYQLPTDFSKLFVISSDTTNDTCSIIEEQKIINLKTAIQAFNMSNEMNNIITLMSNDLLDYSLYKLHCGNINSIKTLTFKEWSGLYDIITDFNVSIPGLNLK